METLAVATDYRQLTRETDVPLVVCMSCFFVSVDLPVSRWFVFDFIIFSLFICASVPVP